MLDNSDGLRGLLKLLEFGLAQKTGNIQKDDQTAFEFANTGHVTGFTLGKNGAGCFDFRRWNFQDFRSGTDNQPQELVSSSTTRIRLRLSLWTILFSKTFTQIHHRDNFPAKVDHALDRLRGIRHGGDFGDADDLANGGDTHSVCFVPDPKSDNLMVFLHGSHWRQDRLTSAYSYSFGSFGGDRREPRGSRNRADGDLACTIDNELVHVVEQVFERA